MDSLVTDHNEYENDLQRLDQVCVDNAFCTNTDGGFTCNYNTEYSGDGLDE